MPISLRPLKEHALRRDVFLPLNAACFRNSVSILSLFATLPFSTLSSQNLVKNPSFEEFTRCPERLGNFDADLVSWSTPTQGSTDYFNACSTAMGTPKNFNGQQHSDFGQGYAGLYLYAPEDYREYVQAELVSPLEEGKEYQVSFQISLAERSDFAIKEFGVLFSNHPLEVPIKRELAKRYWYQQKANSYHYLEITYSKFYDDKEDWIRISTQFTAKGSERFLILGNFKNNSRTRMFKTKKSARQGAYYYVDMVKVEASVQDRPKNDIGFVTEITEMPRKENLESEGSSDSDGRKSQIFKSGTTYVFEDVLFGFDQYVILDSAKDELGRLYDYLTAHPDFGVTINGYTDGEGSEAYNRQLSQNRAKAISEYLVALGISETRIRFHGRGSASPVASNKTKEGRKRNRRVEFVISGE